MKREPQREPTRDCRREPTRDSRRELRRDSRRGDSHPLLALTLSAVTLTTLALVGCAPDAAPPPADADAPDPLAEPQAISLFGEELYAMEDTTGAIAAADSALAEAPDDVDRLIEAGRVRRHFWQYRQAMELYSRAAELAPDDWRPYRFRGHRHISLRDFDRAVEDLEAARERAPLNWDVSYHLGLAYFLAGRFDDAADEYLRCLDLADDPEARAASTDDFRSCAENADDPESRVAMTEWTVRALMRSGRDEEARRLVDAHPADLPVEENVAYHHNLLLYQGEMSVADLLEPGPDAPYRLETVGFGVANWMLARGDTVAARDILERLYADPWWPGFGRIAAEVELARLES
jgi:tetratricopeptide (TPR) repeat protein